MRTRLDTATIRRARRFRESMTDMERKLWSRLRELRHHGFHFRRQVPLRGYYLDFAEHHVRLVVELDGSQHGEDRQHIHDMIRDQVLAQEGYRVLRFGNWEIAEDIERVLAFIIHEAEERLPPTRPASPVDLPTRGR